LGDNVRLEEQVKTLFVNLEKLEKCQKEHEEDDKEAFSGVYKKLDDYQNRLPVWATAVISLLTAVCGWLAGLVVK